MTLRTAGLIAGVLGVVLLAAGLIANSVKPAAQATPHASVDTAVVVVTPQVLALSPDAVLTIGAKGTIAAHTARVADVDAWVASRASMTISGLADWDRLDVSAATPAAPSPDGPGSQDIWRDTASPGSTYTVATADVPPGLALVVEALGGATLTQASLTLPRVVNDDWIRQLIGWGVGLTAIGLIALIALFIDVRPAQTKGEEWLAHRSGIGSGKQPPKPGSRRARRQAGAAVPVVDIPAEPATVSTPAATEETDAPPLVAVARPTQQVPAVDDPVPPASGYQPPDPDGQQEQA